MMEILFEIDNNKLIFLQSLFFYLENYQSVIYVSENIKFIGCSYYHGYYRYKIAIRVKHVSINQFI